MNQTVTTTHRTPAFGLIGGYLVVCAILIAIGAVLLAALSGCTGPRGGCSTTPTSQTQANLDLIVGAVLVLIFAVPAFGVLRHLDWGYKLALLPLGLMLLVALYSLFSGIFFIVTGNASGGAIFGVPALVFVLINGFSIYRLWTGAIVHPPAAA